jgi:phenylalanyl-tRNA synthetase alpha chain
MDNIQNLINTAKEQIAEAKDLLSLEQLRIQYLGKKSELTSILKELGNLAPDQKAQIGQVVNSAKNELKEFLEKQKNALSMRVLEEKLKEQAIDVTMPGRGQDIGTLHPVTKVRMRMQELFSSMGFVVAEGPEIEDEFHNFEALNMPMYHPARTTVDTFYLKNIPYLLRTHTSPVQIRTMQKSGVPLRIIAPGRVFRRDSDSTHTPMFHQLEGFLVDIDISFANLKGILNNFLENFFEEKIETRFRPSYFPFTEPSAEADLKCINCHGQGCGLCSGTGWIEILGCGMIHPNVFKAVGLDSDKYSGFAFGIGIDRFAMFRYGIKDLRILFENDLRFLEQF